jgi:3-methyladenine DNA glycosylase AlkC
MRNEPLKNHFDQRCLEKISKEIQKAAPSFQASRFIKEAAPLIKRLEMKQRVELIAQTLKEYLPSSYLKTAKILKKTLSKVSVEADGAPSNTRGQNGLQGFDVWPLTFYIALYGQDHPETSLRLLIEMTQRFTAEFSIRYYLKNHYSYVMGEFRILAKHPAARVRRLVSEGTRPRLPWGIKVEKINQNIKDNLKLLQKLVNDESAYVRTSVANHLNDISRIDSSLTLDFCRDQLKKHNNNPQLQRLSEKALRTLVKQGHPGALEVLGYDPNVDVAIKKFKILKTSIAEGDDLIFQFLIINQSKKRIPLIIDARVAYRNAKEGLTSRVFKLSKLVLAPGEQSSLQKKISFKRVTTRKHYSGKHWIEIQVNGAAKSRKSFHLSVS